MNFFQKSLSTSVSQSEFDFLIDVRVYKNRDCAKDHKYLNYNTDIAFV